MIISSRSNSTIKRIRALRERKTRDQERLYFVEGIRIVVEAVQTRAEIEQIIVAPDLLTSDLARQTAADQQRAGVPCLEVTGDVFQSLSAKDNPQGIGAVIRQQWHTLGQGDPQTDPWWTALCGVQDPGNLGTILRTTDAVGCAGVILIGATTDPYDPEAVRASMGAIFTQQVIRARLDEIVTWKQRCGGLLVGTSDSAVFDYQSASYPLPLIVLMGSEQHGLSPQEQAVCDQMVRIPMTGRSDSLNLAVATGVMLYEVFNQQRKRNSPHQNV
jgi:TrmH family RNA methyltransferase